jgi:hypothetical protein
VSNNIQKKWNALRFLGYSGTQEDMELVFYLANGATSYSLRDAEMQFLAGKGFTTGTVNDRWYAYLKAFGFSGALDDMMPLFWDDVNALVKDNLLLEDGTNLLQENGSLILL